jgi:hypothetical protein
LIKDGTDIKEVSEVCSHMSLTQWWFFWHNIHQDNPSMSHKIIAMMLQVEGATLNFFFHGEFA